MNWRGRKRASSPASPPAPLNLSPLGDNQFLSVAQTISIGVPSCVSSDAPSSGGDFSDRRSFVSHHSERSLPAAPALMPSAEHPESVVSNTILSAFSSDSEFDILEPITSRSPEHPLRYKSHSCSAFDYYGLVSSNSLNSAHLQSSPPKNIILPRLNFCDSPSDKADFGLRGVAYGNGNEDVGGSIGEEAYMECLSKGIGELRSGAENPTLSRGGDSISPDGGSISPLDGSGSGSGCSSGSGSNGKNKVDTFALANRTIASTPLCSSASFTPPPHSPPHKSNKKQKSASLQRDGNGNRETTKNPLSPNGLKFSMSPPQAPDS